MTVPREIAVPLAYAICKTAGPCECRANGSWPCKENLEAAEVAGKSFMPMVAAEREACALLAEGFCQKRMVEFVDGREIAAAIRARSS